MNRLMMTVCVAAGMSCAMGTAMAEALAPGRIDAPDLSPLKTPNAAKGAPVALVGEDGKALPIVCGGDNASGRAAAWLSSAIEEMTGVKVQVFRPHMTPPKPPNTNNETLEFFFDCSGNGAGYYQLMIDILNQPVSYVASGMKAWKLDGVRSAVARQDDGWSCEVFIPFSCLKGFPGLQLPEGTAAAGKYWFGNFCRFRALRKGEKDGCHTNPNGILSFSRRYTRGRDWNADSSAFGKLQFKE